MAGALQIRYPTVFAISLDVNSVHVPELRAALGIIKDDILNSEILDVTKLNAVNHRVFKCDVL